jgi:hypothetical protein
MSMRQTKSAKPITKCLTRRANQRHINIIAAIIKPARGNRQRVFRFMQDNRSGKFQFVELVALHFLQFVDGSKIVFHVGQIGENPRGEIPSRVFS